MARELSAGDIDAVWRGAAERLGWFVGLVDLLEPLGLPADDPVYATALVARNAVRQLHDAAEQAAKRAAAAEAARVRRQKQRRR